MANHSQEMSTDRSQFHGGMRARSDAQAHDGAPPFNDSAMDHPLVADQSPPLVCEPEALTGLVACLRHAGEFAYDSEFIGEQTFHARFCLLQVATPEHISLIDALAEIDLHPFWRLLADPSVRKIVHAGRQDLEPVVRFLNQTPRNIFDVQLAAGFLGLTFPLSLDRLLWELAQIDAGHSAKFSQWDRRPLTDVQRFYAAADVRFLPLLARRLEQRLRELGNLEWAHAEMRNLEDQTRYRYDPLAQKLRAKGLNELDRRQWSVLQALLRWRARQAEHEDVPPRTLVPDEAMATLARSQATSLSELGKVKFLPKPVLETFGQPMLEAIERGSRDPLAELPLRHPPLTKGQKNRLETLWKAVNQRCDEHHIHPGVVLAKRELTSYVHATHDAPSAPPRPKSRLLEGWRGELLGDILLDRGR